MPAKTPEECDALFEKYVNAGDLDSLVDLYEPGATLVSAPGQMAVGRDAIREALGGLRQGATQAQCHADGSSAGI